VHRPRTPQAGCRRTLLRRSRTLVRRPGPGGLERYRLGDTLDSSTLEWGGRWPQAAQFFFLWGRGTAVVALIRKPRHRRTGANASTPAARRRRRFSTGRLQGRYFVAPHGFFRGPGARTRSFATEGDLRTVLSVDPRSGRRRGTFARSPHRASTAWAGGLVWFGENWTGERRRGDPGWPGVGGVRRGSTSTAPTSTAGPRSAANKAVPRGSARELGHTGSAKFYEIMNQAVQQAHDPSEQEVVAAMMKLPRTDPTWRLIREGFPGTIWPPGKFFTTDGLWSGGARTKKHEFPWDTSKRGPGRRGRDRYSQRRE